MPAVRVRLSADEAQAYEREGVGQRGRQRDPSDPPFGARVHPADLAAPSLRVPNAKWVAPSAEGPRGRACRRSQSLRSKRRDHEGSSPRSPFRRPGLSPSPPGADKPVRSSRRSRRAPLAKYFASASTALRVPTRPPLDGFYCSNWSSSRRARTQTHGTSEFSSPNGPHREGTGTTRRASEHSCRCLPARLLGEGEGNFQALDRGEGHRMEGAGPVSVRFSDSRES